MADQKTERTLDQLDQLKNDFGKSAARKVAALLKRSARLVGPDANSLIRLHEILLFLRAYPHNSSIAKAAETQLKTFPTRISRLSDEGVDLTGLEHPEVSGIAGTCVIDTFSYSIVLWLQKNRGSQIDLYWDWFEDENRLADIWPRFMAILEEDGFVEANVPYRTWLRNARGNLGELNWLIKRFSQAPLTDLQRAELYNAQKVYVRWRYSYRDSRTGLRLPTDSLFYHNGPLIERRDVNLRNELKEPSRPLEKLPVAQGQRAIEMAKIASTVRYRELYGFTNGDPKSVYRTSLGRGVELAIITLPPDRRLPLRAYHSAMIYKNGVPVGYFEGLSLFERMESGFNLYYTFRDGETAWLYAQTLKVMRQLTGVSAFSLDPYQIGFGNEEGIKSGAFWFYRKLGFRSTRRSIQRLTEGEESKIASRKDYRTSPVTLRRLAEAPMIFELDESRRGDWDRFQIRNIGFAVQRLMAQRFDGDAGSMRANAVESATKILRLKRSFHDSNPAIVDFTVMLLLIPDLDRWSSEEKELLARIIRAKEGEAEGRYLRLMQQHVRLREAMIQLGIQQ